MAKANKQPVGSSLRILAIAYAGGRITRDAYLKERTRQIGALEFDKEMPPLPDELLDIAIPTVKIDASYINAKKRNKGRNKLIAAAIVLLLLGSGSAGLWFGGFFEPPPKPQVQTEEPKLSDFAGRLLQNPNWSERDIKAFLRLWAKHSNTAREQARNAGWYLKLDNEIIKRINHARLQLDSAGDDVTPGQERQLQLLRAFQSRLSS